MAYTPCLRGLQILPCRTMVAAVATAFINLLELQCGINDRCHILRMC